jgi:hypothetical protein
MPQQPPKPLISPEYMALNKRLHADKPSYGADAAKDAAGIVKFARAADCSCILDYGCGKGTLKPAIQAIAPDLRVLEYDPAVEGKDQLPEGEVDLIAAMDVMEHIEPAYLDAVLHTMAGLRPKLVILKIALTPAKKNLPDGRNAHILLQPSAWWFEKLQGFFAVTKCQELPLHFVYIGEPLPIVP